MRKLLLIVLCSLFALAAGQDPKLEYIQKYHKLAVEEMRRSGVPASITLAQGLLESASGQSLLATKGNNHFGIKCHNDWKGETMYMDDDKAGECFRVYDNVKESYKAHSDFLRSRDRYKSLFELPSDDYAAWARGLKAAGYATDPAYANKLIKLIEDYDLAYYDTDIKPVIKAPKEIETPKIIVPEEIERNYKEYITFAVTRDIFIQNGTPFVYAIEGETYSSIAAQNNLFLKEILKFNDLKEEAQLNAGEIVYLGLKKSKAAKGVEKYTVDKTGETLYEISQRFGIRYIALLKMNISLGAIVLEEGDTVRLR